MDSYLQQLENNEAILLMYLNNELPPQDRIEVDQMLASDAILRADLETLRQAQQTAMRAMEVLDRSVALPVSPAVAVRQIVREMNRRKLKTSARPAATVAARRLPWWSWALPTAAAAMLGFVIWTVYNSSNVIDNGPAHLNRFPFMRGNMVMVPHELSKDEKFDLLRHSFDAMAADNEGDLSLSVVASKSEDADFSLDLAHGGDSNPQ